MTEIKNILLIGRTGSGKSTLANVLSRSEDFRESASLTSETRKAKAKEFKANGVQYRIIDTIGLADTSLSTKKLAAKFKGEVGDYVKEGLNQIFFVIGGRATEEVITSYKWLISFLFDKNALKYTTIIRTRFPEFKNIVECEADTEKLVELDRELFFPITELGGRIIYLDNDKSNESRRESRDMLLIRLLDCRDVVYKPMNWQRTKEEFDLLKSELNPLVNKLNKKNESLLRNFISNRGEEWIKEDFEENSDSELRNIKKSLCEVFRENEIAVILEKFKELIGLGEKIKEGNFINRERIKKEMELRELRNDYAREAEGKLDNFQNQLSNLLEIKGKIVKERFSMGMSNSVDEDKLDRVEGLEDELNKVKKVIKKALTTDKIRKLLKKQEELTRVEIMLGELEASEKSEIQIEILNSLNLQFPKSQLTQIQIPPK